MPDRYKAVYQNLPKVDPVHHAPTKQEAPVTPVCASVDQLKFGETVRHPLPYESFGHMRIASMDLGSSCSQGPNLTRISEHIAKCAKAALTFDC